MAFQQAQERTAVWEQADYRGSGSMMRLTQGHPPVSQPRVMFLADRQSSAQSPIQAIWAPGESVDGIQLD